MQAFYADLDNLRQVHPLIVSVRRLARTETEHGYRQTYRIRDRIPFGPVAVPISYQTRLWVRRGAAAPRQAIGAHTEMLAGIRRSFEQEC